jgi:uncharacterized protein
LIAVHVAQLLQAPVGSTRAYDFGEVEPQLSSELQLLGAIEGNVTLTRTSHGILVDCAYQVERQLECGRCLGPTRTIVDNRFSLEFLPTIDVHTGLPQETVADLEEPRIRPDHLLDLTDAIRQDIVLQEPIQPLCQFDCVGLCSACGQNLNQVSCACGPVDSAPPIGSLGEALRRAQRRSEFRVPSP